MTSTGNIRAIGFDYLGVIAHMSEGDMFDLVAAETETSRETVKTAYQRYSRRFQLGEIDQVTLWRHVADDLKMKPEHYRALWQHVTTDRLPRLDPAVLELSDQLRAAGYRTGLLSNLAPDTAWSDDLYRQGVDRHFDVVLLSGEIGFAKPDPRAYQLLARRLKLKTSELVFTDDRAESMAGIEQLSIQPVVFRNLDQLTQDLRALGVHWA